MNRTSISDPKQVLGAAFNYYMREVYKNFSHSDDLRMIRHSLEIKLSRIAYVIDNAFTAINDNLKDYLHNPQYLGKLDCMPEVVLATDFLEDDDDPHKPLTLHQWLSLHFDNSIEPVDHYKIRVKDPTDHFTQSVKVYSDSDNDGKFIVVLPFYDPLFHELTA